ncbi:hypothetical protein [Lampropedia aestuarii]|uniref:hypothetical protein n=1 Tax=Lampropedia aestuarii TaxID=2562762 RepID=UPI0024693A7A|nr:hypothetical protein [Lampropedia aestuarii]MDH5857307.1 hypothetical protein [Lampropedia aestuarii]
MSILTTSEFNKPMTQLVRAEPIGVNSWDSTQTLNAGPTGEDLSLFTGLSSPNNPLGTAALNWSSGMQVSNGKIGMYLNGYETPVNNFPDNTQEFMGYWSMAAYKSFPVLSDIGGNGDPCIYPFRNGQALRIGLRTHLGQVYVTPNSGAGCQIYNGIGFRLPTVNGVPLNSRGIYRFEIISLLWDSRTGNITEYPLNLNDGSAIDAFGAMFVGTYPGGRNFSTNYGDQAINGLENNRTNQFYYDITRENISNVLKVLKLEEVNPDDVYIAGFTLQGELFGPPNAEYKFSQFGAYFDNVNIDVW